MTLIALGCYDVTLIALGCCVHHVCFHSHDSMPLFARCSPFYLGLLQWLGVARSQVAAPGCCGLDQFEAFVGL